MTEKGLRVLENLVSTTYIKLIGSVIVGEDKNIENDFSKEIISLCKRSKIDCQKRKEFREINTFYSIAISWRWLIPVQKSNQLIVLHDSLLPKYRGFAPLVNQLINGERQIGVTALLASENYDEGDIVYQSKSNIEYPITIAQAISIITDNYVEIVQKIFTQISSNLPFKSTPQNHREATYSLWRDDEDYHIDWCGSAERIKRFIDAVGPPYKGALSFINDQPARIYEASIVEDVTIENRTPGKVIFFRQEKPIVVCGKGLLQIDHAVFEDGTSIFPIKKFRSRFH